PLRATGRRSWKVLDIESLGFPACRVGPDAVCRDWMLIFGSFRAGSWRGGPLVPARLQFRNHSHNLVRHLLIDLFETFFRALLSLRPQTLKCHRLAEFYEYTSRTRIMHEAVPGFKS